MTTIGNLPGLAVDTTTGAEVGEATAVRVGASSHRGQDTPPGAATGAKRLAVRLAVPGGVITVWLVAVTVLGLWDRVGDGLVAAATMTFGSLVAGSTPQGGGAVAFPVFTKLLEVPAAAARTFSLSIQAVGMGTAAVLIVMRRLPVAWRAVRVVAASASVSFLLALVLLTDEGAFRPSIVPADVTKVGFTVLIAALAVLTVRLRRVELPRSDVDLDSASLRLLVLTGVLGGALSALLGSGADVVAFLALTLLFGVRPGVAVPSSVVIMAILSILGLITLGLADGQLLSAEATVDLPALWLAAVPVVAVGAPLGSWLASKASDRLLLGVIVTLAATEVVSSIVFLDRLRMDPVLALGAVAVGVLVVHALWAAHRRRFPAGGAAAVSSLKSRPHVRLAPAIPASVFPSPVSHPAESTDRRPDHDRRGVPMTANAEDRPVLVGGVTSRSGHLNHPEARYCRRTGQRLEGLVGLPVTGPRPTLAVLCTDDGTSVPLAVDLVVGRYPRRHHLVTDGAADPLVLADESGSLSRAHLLIALRGWDVRVADLGSSNGTWLRSADNRSWTRLAVGEAVTLGSGSSLACGDRRLRIDHLHVR